MDVTHIHPMSWAEHITPQKELGQDVPIFLSSAETMAQVHAR